jgi:hypothetical protein
MILSLAATIILVLASILVMYETMRLTSDHLSQLPLPPRPRMMLVVLAIFAGHTVTIFLYALAYWLLVIEWQIGGFAGTVAVTGFMDCLYFSAITYTSLGFGDLYPVSDIRMVSGFEALNGLLLIGWSATFTYLTMQRLWPMHKARKRKAGSTRRPRA